MTVEEIKKAYAEMKAQGATDDDILGTLYAMYKEQKLSTDELREMTDILGYEFTPEFDAMSEEDKHENGVEYEEDSENISEEQIEDAKETESEGPKGEEKPKDGEGEGEGNPEPKDNNPEPKDDDKSEEEPKGEEPKGEDNGGEDEEKDRAEAMKLFGFSK